MSAANKIPEPIPLGRYFAVSSALPAAYIFAAFLCGLAVFAPELSSGGNGRISDDAWDTIVYELVLFNSFVPLGVLAVTLLILVAIHIAGYRMPWTIIPLPIVVGGICWILTVVLLHLLHRSLYRKHWSIDVTSLSIGWGFCEGFWWWKCARHEAREAVSVGESDRSNPPPPQPSP